MITEIINEPKYIFPLIVLLIGALITIRYQEYRKIIDKFEKDYSEFKEAFQSAIKMLEDQGTYHNKILLSEFLVHNEAKRRFIHNLKGLRLRRFNKKWAEYEKEYKHIESLGLMGAIATIVPNISDLDKVGKGDGYGEILELQKKRQILKQIHDILKVAEKKRWF